MWLFWVVLVIVIVIVARNMTANASGSSNDETPLTILKKRFARGEIDESEYKRRAQELEK
jgi:putative membrane protein